ncbi:M23 family metallopeptidase [Thiomicrospira sp. ALE5]|uniref:M23 family metallopeptidase n=1 Tax=Thiomicrospira sp. ALE5 TaxID=748650 RepID=UPI0008EFE5EC|nr:M23 family metallopeptidase [Thiomicrospira sp. ALE5]SFR48765.1 Peptidase family M23 [Thiomicrospira sp. ALE5]
MKNRISITVSDIRGAKHYSVSAFLKKFVLLVLAVSLFMSLLVVLGFIWTYQQYEQIKYQQYQSESAYLARMAQYQVQRDRIAEQKQQLLYELSTTERQVVFLDETLRSLEDLVGSPHGQDEYPIEERVKLLQLSALEKQFLLQALPTGRPVSNFQGVSSGYGWRQHPVRGTREFHSGIDYRGSRGDGVIATADGIVEYASYNKGSGYGNLIILSHAFGFRTFYAHLDTMNVRAGQYVHSGDLIGTIGNTGVSTGPHLHYEVTFIQRKLDPAPFVEWNLENYENIFEQVEGVPWGSLVQAVHQQVQKTERLLSQKGFESEAN